MTYSLVAGSVKLGHAVVKDPKIPQHDDQAAHQDDDSGNAFVQVQDCGLIAAQVQGVP